jgi:hypothetical protein
MATSFVYNRVNLNGVPCIESRSISQSTNSVTFNFNASPAVNSRFSGLIAIKIIEQAATSADSLPVSFNVPSIAGTVINLTTFGGTSVTGVEMTEGIHLVFYDRENGILQLLV